jgi:hypothetical protein
MRKRKKAKKEKKKVKKQKKEKRKEENYDYQSDDTIIIETDADEQKKTIDVPPVQGEEEYPTLKRTDSIGVRRYFNSINNMDS